MTPPIAILGAGPSGLAFGRLLEVAGIDYIIFERDTSPDSGVGQGGTLDLHAGSGQLALREAGLWEEFKKYARSDGSNRIADFQGKVLADLGADGENERPEIDRKDLRGLLLRSVPEGRIRWGRRVEGVVKEEGGMSVRFEDGGVEGEFELVVGADGAWSKVRSLVTPAKPVYSGYHILTTHIRKDNPAYPAAVSLAGNGNYMSFGKLQFLVMKLGNGSYHTGIGLPLPEDWSKEHPIEVRHARVQEYTRDCPDVHRDILQNSDDEFRAWPLYSMPTESLSWESVPGVALIGDAAHVSTPFEGEGVNCALYDSVQLAQQIRKYGMADLHRAVAEYEREMFPRAIDLISRSAKNGEMMFAEDAPRGFLQKVGIECD